MVTCASPSWLNFNRGLPNLHDIFRGQEPQAFDPRQIRHSLILRLRASPGEPERI